MTDAPLTLYAKLRDGLRASILDGVLQPLDKLPSESQLAETHAVSRITVRQALGDLQKEGLIVRQQGKGAFVSAPRRASQNLDRLQGLGESMSAQGHAVHGKRLRMKRIKAPASVAPSLGLTAKDEVWHMISLRYVDREAISVNSSYFPLVLGDRVARLDLSGRDVIDVLEKDLGKTITQANSNQRHGHATAGRQMADVSPGTPALCVQRLVFDTSNTVLQVETVIYRADRFSYQLNLAR